MQEAGQQAVQQPAQEAALRALAQHAEATRRCSCQWQLRARRPRLSRLHSLASSLAPGRGAAPPRRAQSDTAGRSRTCPSAAHAALSSLRVALQAPGERVCVARRAPAGVARSSRLRQACTRSAHLSPARAQHRLVLRVHRRLRFARRFGHDCGGRRAANLQRRQRRPQRKRLLRRRGRLRRRESVSQQQREMGNRRQRAPAGPRPRPAARRSAR